MSQETNPPLLAFYTWDGRKPNKEADDKTFDQYVESCEKISMSSFVITVLENHKTGMWEKFSNVERHPEFEFRCSLTGKSQMSFRIARNGGKILCGRFNEGKESTWDICYEFELAPGKEWIPVSFTGPGDVEAGKLNSAKVTEFAKSFLKERVWTKPPGKEIQCEWFIRGAGWFDSSIKLDPNDPKCEWLADD